MKIRRGFVQIIVQILIKQKYFQHCDLNNTIYDLHSIECNKSSARSSGKEKTQSCSQINIKHAEDEKQGNNGWRGGGEVILVVEVVEVQKMNYRVH